MRFSALINACTSNNQKPVDDTDKSRVKQDIKRAKHLGLIEVKISRIEVGETLPKLFAQDKQIAEFSIAEKALKGRAVSHGTR